MNKQRKTSHILNVFQYDADGHVVLPASLTLGIVPGAEDNSGKVPSTAWVRGLLTTRSSTLVPINRTITINGTSYDLSSNPSFSINTGVLTATAGAGISVSVSNQNLNIVNTGLLTATSGAGITVSTSNQNVNIVNTGLLTATSGAGITVSTVNQNVNIVNTGLLTATSGAGITVTTSNQNVNIVNTGLLTATAGAGITVTTSNQNVNIVNNGILTATAGAGISVTTSNGNLNIVNTITNNNQLDNGAGYATTSYVTTQINNLVAGAPGLLDTLDELAAALGDDANFATTITTSISTKQAQLNGTGFVKVTGTTVSYDNSTYLTTGTAASTYVSLTGSYSNPSWITALGWGKITGTPTTISGYGITNAYTDAQIQNFFNGANAITGYNKSNWDTAYGWGNHASVGYLTGITSSQVTTALGYTPYNSSNPSGYITGISFANVSSKPTTLSGYGITDAMAYFNGASSIDYNSITTNGIYRAQGGINGPTGAHATVFSAFQVNGDYGWQLASSSSDNMYFRYKDAAWGSWSTIATRSWVTSQGYITGYTETDTLASVTARGASTSTALTISGVVISTSGSHGYVRPAASNGSLLLGDDSGSATRGIVVNNNGGAVISTAASGQVILDTQISGTSVLRVNGNQTVTILGNTVLTAGNYSSYALPLTGGTLSGPLTINTTGDIVANGDTFRMKGGGGSAEFIWYRNYSGDPSHPGFVIINRSGTTTFSHNSNGGGTSVSGNFYAANFTGSSSGVNTGDQTNISGLAASETLSTVTTRGNSTTRTLTSTNTLGLYVNSGGASYIGINSTSSWAYTSLLNNGTTTWDLGAFSGGSFEFRPYGGENNRIIVGLNGVMYFTDTTNGIYKSGGRFTVRSESTDNVANFASYGLYLPQTAQTAGLYVESPIEARGGIRMGSGAVNGTITVGATTGATADRLVQRDSGGDIYSRYSFAIHFNASCPNNENPSIAAIWTNSGSDNYLRKSTPAHLINQLGLVTNSGTWGIRITGFANQGTARLYSTDSAYNYDAANPYFGYLTYDGSRWLFQVSPGTPAAVRVAYADSAGSASSASQVTINYNNDSNSTYQLLWGSGNSVYGTAQVYVNPSSDVIYARGGYISPGNAWGTSDSAFFPNGITTAGGTNWIYGLTYIGNAPGNGAGHEFYTSGSSYSTGNMEAGSSMRAPIFYDRNDTTYYLDPNASGTSLRIAGNIHSDGSFGTNGYSSSSPNVVSRVFAPKGAAFSSDGSTGAIRIKLPFRGNNPMWTMKVRIYNYSTNQTSEYLLGNYAYDQGGYNSSATFLGGSGAAPLTVRFGNQDGVDCVWIGETNTSWSYPVVSVLDFTSGFRASDAGSQGTGWNIAIVTSFGTIGTTISPSIRFSDVSAAGVSASNIYASSDVRGNDVYTTGGWFRNHTNSNGIYWSTTGWHLMPASSSDFRIHSGSNTDSALRFETNGTTRGYVYAENDNTIGFLTNARGWAFRTYSNGDARVYGYLYVNGGGTASSIYMSDTDEGQREIHCNSNRIGFLNQSGSWGSWCDDSGNWLTGAGVYAGIFYDYDNGGYYLDPNSTSNLLHIQMPHRGNGTPNLLVNNGGSENWRAIQIEGGSGNLGIGKSDAGRSWSGRVSLAMHVGASESFRVHSDGWDSLFEVWGSSGYARLKGSLEVGSDVYLGTRGTWLSSWLNQNVTTGASPSFSEVTAGYHRSYYLTGRYDVSVDHTYGIYFSSYVDYSYAIFRESGAWNHPYPDLRIAFHTGIKIGAYYGYNGTRFYNNSDMATITASVNDGDNNFRGYYDIIAYASDKRLKENIKVIDNAVDKVKQLTGMTYTWNRLGTQYGWTPSNEREAGVFAQDVQAVLPEAVKLAPFDNSMGVSKSGENFLTVKYEKIVPLLIEAIKEQQNQIEELQNKLDNVLSSR